MRKIPGYCIPPLKRAWLIRFLVGKKVQININWTSHGVILETATVRRIIRVKRDGQNARIEVFNRIFKSRCFLSELSWKGFDDPLILQMRRTLWVVSRSNPAKRSKLH